MHAPCATAMGQRAQSLTLAGIMFLSVLTGMLMLDLDNMEVSQPNLAPAVTGDSGSELEFGTEPAVMLLVSDEDLNSITMTVLIDGVQYNNFSISENGEVWIGIPTDEVGVVLVEATVFDDEGLSDTWSGTFTVRARDMELLVSDPLPANKGSKLIFGGTLLHHDLSDCKVSWRQADGSGGALPVQLQEDGRFSEEIEGVVGTVTITVFAECGAQSTSTDFQATWLEGSASGCTDTGAINYEENATQDDGTCQYHQDADGDGVPDGEDQCQGHDDSVDEDGNGVPDGCENQIIVYDPSDLGQFWIDKFLCQGGEGPVVDDYNTTVEDGHLCEVSVVVDSNNVTLTMNGLPNHDFQSGPGCCAGSQVYNITIPRSPTNDTHGGHDSTNCPEAAGLYECAPIRGSIGYALNGVPLFGPEDGPGGDAVASHHGQFQEDRQDIWLGLCHGHSGPGGTYHYHADANCIHWHGHAEELGWENYSFPPNLQGDSSPVIGVAFDGYPIYGAHGVDASGAVSEMKSSYRLKDGETGYNGIEDYEYVEGSGDLDVCNGHFGPTPDFPGGIYHYHSTMKNGLGDMGFPYFLICYRGQVPESSENDPCAGYGEDWGPGIGPPPEGCGEGQSQDQDAKSAGIPLEVTVPPFNGFPILGIIFCTWMVIYVRESAFSKGSRDLVGTAPGYHQARV